MKKLVRPILAGAGLTGALAAANRALGNAPLPTNALGGTRVPWTWRGHEIFATEAGSGPLTILIHGVSPGASSYEYRKLFPLLARRGRVLAFDLLGCGLSEKPNIAYNCDLFVEQVVDALDAFDAGPVSIVASSLGAAFAIRAATRATGRVERLAVVCPIGSNVAARPAARSFAITALFRTPVVGEATFNALASRAALRWHLEHHVYGDPSHCTPHVVDHYYAVAHQPGARYVAAALLAGALDCDLARDLPFLDTPLHVLWGARAPAPNPPSKSDEVLRLARDARLTTFEDSGLLPHEEEPEAVAAVLGTASAVAS